MKVLFVYKYLTLGGVETVLRARLDGLERWGIEAHAWFFHDLGGRAVFAGREDRIRVGEIQNCLSYLVRGAFDLLVSIDTEEILPGLADLGGPSRRQRLVFECHSPYLENIEYLRGLAAAEVAPAAVFVPSEYQRRIVMERVGEGIPVRVVPNPLCQSFMNEPAAFPSPPPRPVLAWIGRMDDLKNWRGFVELAGAVGRNGRELEVWIAGKPIAADGASELRSAAEAAKILGRLRWFRGLPHARVPAFLDAVRDSGGVVVSTSRGESFGMTVAEGMARRCAVAAPAMPPLTEFVEDGVTGALFSPGPVEPAARRIEALLEDGDLRAELGRRAREVVLQRFAPEPALTALARELERVAET